VQLSRWPMSFMNRTCLLRPCVRGLARV